MFAMLSSIDALAAETASEPPRRVVSMNLCTDQLALLVAAPGQLVSVSHWAQTPTASMMVEEARALPANYGRAEEIFRLKPDLVLAGMFTSANTVAMLERLGIEVAQFDAERSMADVRSNLRRVGALLGQQDRAEAAVAAFDLDLRRLEGRAAKLDRREAAYHYPNNYTSGSGTLAADVMNRAALDNAAQALGLSGAARLDLETLVLSAPYIIRTRHIGEVERGRSFETAAHPALKSLIDTAGGTTLEGRWQICGTPFVLRAIEALLAAREAEGAAGEASPAD